MANPGEAKHYQKKQETFWGKFWAILRVDLPTEDDSWCWEGKPDGFSE
jgi:hypothetical protein